MQRVKFFSFAFLMQIQAVRVEMGQIKIRSPTTTLAQMQDDVWDHFEPLNDQEVFAMNSGFWFEMCVNIQEAFVYCKHGQTKSVND